MPFLGTIPAKCRPILHEIVTEWQPRALAIGCSGNFTIERTMADLGLDLYSCDVSLYSYAIGSALSGQAVDIRLSERGRELAPWAEQSLGTADAAAAAVMLLLDFAPSFGHPERLYSQRLLATLEREWLGLHRRTLDKFQEKRPAVVKSYFNGDVRQYIRDLPEDVPFMSFPPFYKGGYEKMFKQLGELLDWPAPTYEIIDDNAVEVLLESVKAKCERWCIGLKEPHPPIAHLLRGVVEQRGNIPMYVYASQGPNRFVGVVPAKTEPLGIPELEDIIEVTAASKVELMKVPLPRFEFLRVKHLAKHIATVAPTAAALVLVDGKVAGAFGISAERFKYNGAYLLSDFSVLPNSRLSKLVLYAALSREGQLFVQRVLNKRVRTLLTTAFSTHPVSMKYRGLFDLQSRKKAKDSDRYQLNYVAKTGQWTLQEGFEKWLAKNR
ncbi:MAG: hypothetical protein ACKVT1_05610 [Dehalococcoidia bacterium]